MYSSVPNRSACTFISGKVCLLTLIEDKGQTLPDRMCLHDSIRYTRVGAQYILHYEHLITRLWQLTFGNVCTD